MRSPHDVASLDSRRASAPREPFPDRALLEAVLPRFDGATQAIAGGVILEGRPQDEVAASLGVTRRTVQSKLGQFLAIARSHLAVATAAAALAGCGGGPSAPGAAAAASPASSPPAASSPRAVGMLPDRAAEAAALASPPTLRRAGLKDRIRDSVAAGMRRHAPAVHGRVARAIVAEAGLAELDPLLVLAVIGVESRFDPQAVSSAGAVGLMQLREATMRREVERSGLRSADPRDPVANVQAGVRYLRRLVDAFGDLDLALMAYNAGPARIRDHLRRGEIPRRFQAYPRKVKGELRRLRLAVGAGAAAAEVAEAEPTRRGPLG